MNTTTKWDGRVLVGAGGLLLTLSLGFLWNELQVRGELVVVGVAALCALLTLKLREGQAALVGPVATLATALGAGLFWLATKESILLWGLMATLGAGALSLVAVRNEEAPLRRMLLWYGLAMALLAVTGCASFHVLTLGLPEEHLARRLTLTLTWLVLGVGAVLVAHKKGERPLRDAGFGFLLIALLKLLAYDTVHLDGVVRVGGVAFAGLLLLGAGWVSNRVRPPAVERS